ncbi:DNA repair protein RAD2 [Nakaseomyces bracarensis]|uniref:DNA repair protein RAD2 n=1 Tax=Nakaseomyces bracarensis TaxID=273131 RepID=A0ABR4NR19_9SACH
MGVHSFWDIVGPTAKPVRLESLQDRKMAVDASIWIYQFLKAVRDKEGNAIKSAHITGFFRRVCKLLYFGIQPVFVFDGGVPVLKRKTIQKRKERREGKRENASRTAKRILAKQLQTLKERGSLDDSNSNGGNGDTRTNVFKPFDEWDLPEIPGFKYSRNDERVNSAENFEKLINSIDTDVIDDIDLDAINPASKEFEELPKTTQFMILSTLRLRSRLRMGYTKDQLENIFPDSMDFSKFQIDMLKRRNFFTQKLINVTGINDGGASKLQEAVENDGNRFAGKNSKEYKLLKTENGWTLGFGDYDGSEASKAISLEDTDKKMIEQVAPKNREENGCGDDEEEEFEWEDIELKPEPKKNVEDYSLKAARMLTSNPTAGEKRGTLQSFLDTRPSEISPRKMMAQEGLKKPIHIIDEQDEQHHDEVIDISSDSDSDNEYEEQLKEIEAIENFNRKRNLENALNEQSKSESTKIRKTNNVTSDNAVPERISMKPPVLTEAQQNLKYIVDKIPALDNIETGSLLFGPQTDLPKVDGIPELEKDKIEARNKEKDSSDKEPAQIPEMPSWFENTSTSISYNPYQNTNFVEDSATNENNEGLDNNNNFGFQMLSGPLPEFNLPTTSESNVEKENDIEILKINEPDSRTNEEDKDAEKSDESEGEIDIRQPEVFAYDFSEDEEEQLTETMRKEEEEFREFRVTALNNSNVGENAFIEDEIYAQQVKDKRDADEVTIDMIREVQELLARFGIPYITAPMEAEAQCAELVHLSLVDGIITDDSDVFLFGGRKVYKNMFHERNYVEYYDSETIFHGLGLSRENMIELAQLLGSDYTTGIKGMGPVSSMEVIAEFGSLENFKKWYNEGQFDKKKQESENKFQRDLRKKLVKNEVVLEADFPSPFVFDSYLNPEVDHDKTPFVWASPDLDMLRDFLYKYLGWPQEKSDEVLIPLIRDINARKKAPKQSTLTDFFPREYLDQKKFNLGKRITTATGKLKQRRTQ